MRHAYGRPVNLPDISAHANLSPYHFLRVYKQAYERFYGTEAIVKDNSGNWFSLTQSKR